MPITEPAPIERDEMGLWFHPDLPVYEEGEKPDEPFSDWCVSVGIEARIVGAEYDMDGDDFDRICDSGDCTEWQPTKPEGVGWCLIAINDTDDGPIAAWARPREAA